MTMATIAPPRIPEALTGTIASEKLVEALRPWRRRLTVQQALTWTGFGIVTGLILACILLLVSRLLPWAAALYWAIGVGSTCLLCALAIALWFRPSMTRTARLVDGRVFDACDGSVVVGQDQDVEHHEAVTATVVPITDDGAGAQVVADAGDPVVDAGARDVDPRSHGHVRREHEVGRP